MRTDPPRFYRPRVPRIDSFVERLEDALRFEIRTNPPRRPNPLQRLFDYWSRLILRPIFHGGTVTILFVFVLLSLRPDPVTQLTDAQNARIVSASDVSLWVDVVQVPDPSPRYLPLAPRERAPRFVAFAASAPATPDLDPVIGQRPV